MSTRLRGLPPGRPSQIEGWRPESSTVHARGLPLTMVDRSAVNNLREAEKYVLYAHGYLDSAINFCESMVLHEERRTWPNAAVVLLTAVHSAELFLMGAILARAPATDTRSQALDTLMRTYGALYHEPAFHFELPFRTTSPSALETETEALNAPEPIPAIFYRRIPHRMPVKWVSILNFDAQEFLDTVTFLRTTYERIGRSTTPHLRK